jgi:uncharacterized protein
MQAAINKKIDSNENLIYHVCELYLKGTKDFRELKIMITIHLDQLIDKEHRLEFKEKPEAFDVLADMINTKACAFLTPIKTRLRAYRIGDIVEVQGNLEAAVRLACCRCLSEFETSIASHFTLTYMQENIDSLNKLPDEDVELRPDDIGLIPFRGEEINLIEGIQEQVVIAFPLKPLCREKCRGLCPKCGSILNEGDCGCDKSAFNTNFAVLKNLIIDR